ncbi:hypothetical protein GCM10022261_26000 [Brevibacterium daeguense]|uniref:Uncharacterized protein n=1 Tax=Brevibacterium daeguense TaxID=909936 RepID=A0ABP8EM43_9MICO
MIGAFEAARILVFLLVVSLVVAAVAWFVGIAQQRPLSAMVTWAATGIASANGFTVSVDTFTHSLSPTMLVLITWLLVLAAGRRTARALAANDRLVHNGHLTPSRRPRLVAGLALGLTYGLVTAAVSFLVGSASADLIGLLRFLLLVVSAVLLGLAAAPISEAVTARFDDAFGPRWTRSLHSSGRIFKRTAVLSAVLAFVALAAALAAGWGPALETLQVYSAPAVAGVGLGLVQTVFAPTLLVLALAWVSGAGFQLATGVTTSPYHSVDVPVANVPALAAIPQDPAGWMAALPAAVVLVGVVAVLGRRRWYTLDWAAALFAGAEIFVVALVIGLFCSGSLGPGGLDDFGVVPWLFAGAVAVELTVGLLIGCGMLRLAGRVPAAEHPAGQPG